MKIFDRDRTICDILQYEKKFEKEVFNKAIQSYVKDDKKNIRKLLQYADVLNIKGKVQTYIGCGYDGRYSSNYFGEIKE